MLRPYDGAQNPRQPTSPKPCDHFTWKRCGDLSGPKRKRGEINNKHGAAIPRTLNLERRTLNQKRRSRLNLESRFKCVIEYNCQN